jgi:uncharacterized repeat protein (TIGR03806 family)
VYADYQFGPLFGLFFNDETGAPEQRLLVETPYYLSSFGESLEGELYLLRYSATDGQVLKIVPAADPEPDTFPTLLSATGCALATDPRVPSPGVIPYDLNVALWSDRAEKERHLALPDGATMHVLADGDIELPIGTVLMKTFYLLETRIETRLFMRHDDGFWAGYSYAWNDDGTDAVLLPGAGTRLLADQRWYFPSRRECLACHTEAAGRALGLTLPQLRRSFVYEGNIRSDQLQTMEHIGLFDAALPADIVPMPRIDDDTAPIEARARAYLDANCSHCHRPNSTGQGQIDLLAQTPLSQTGTCNALPDEGDLGIADARIIAPGEPAASLLSVRMRSLDAARMPDLATSIVDEVGVATVDGWIESLVACP